MITARLEESFIRIIFKASSMSQFQDYLQKVKNISGRKFHPNNKEAYWTIPIQQKDMLDHLFGQDQIEWEDGPLPNILTNKNISTDITYINELKLSPYPFQVLGINFLCDVKRGMLADEMGLGKTPQILGAIYKLFKLGKIKKTLIIVPATLKYQWKEEIHKFIDIEKTGIEYIIIDGNPKQRVEKYNYLLNNDKVLYTIINYELILNDVDYLIKHNWDLIALDESHRIKDRKGKTSEAIRQLDAPYKWAITGTPMQNKPDELFSIFSFVNPEILGNWKKFRSTYIVIGTKFNQPNMILGYKKLRHLHEKIAPYMLRRLKKDVAPELPEMLINNYYIPMTPEQFIVHEIVKEELIDTVKEISKFTERNEDGEIIKQHPKADHILGMFIMMQGICDTPELLKISESKMAARYAQHISNAKAKKSPKLDELIIILKNFISNYEGLETPKAVIFTQFERMQRLIVAAISKIGATELINGSMNSNQKQERITNFKVNNNIKFIVCTDSANAGINLQEASLLINFDIPWNPAVWLQRNARIHRINSKHDSINIINLISINGLDERMLEVLYNKQDMAASVIESNDIEKEYLNKLTGSMISKLLKQ